MGAFNIAPYLGKARNRVFRVGIELEGGWKKLPEGVRQLVRDGSIHIQDPATQQEPAFIEAQQALRRQYDRAVNQAQRDHIQRQAVVMMQEYEARRHAEIARGGSAKALHVGELPSDILEPGKFHVWMKQSYPNVVNETCGMHVHMSFAHALHYSRLMVREYPETVVDAMTTWAKDERLPEKHPIWNRLLNQSRFCQHRFEPDLQILKTKKEYDQSTPGNRYTHINYCWGNTETIECRLLPMMETAEQGISAVQRLIDVTNASLVVIAKNVRSVHRREPKVVSEVVVDNQLATLSETRVEYV